jgi:hypothetical protein
MTDITAIKRMLAERAQAVVEMLLPAVSANLLYGFGRFNW